MVTKEISLQLVKNLGNYETMRLQVDCIVEDGEDVTRAFLEAKKQLDDSFIKLTMKEPQTKPKPPLLIGTDEFDRVCKSLHDGKADLELVNKHYFLSKDILNYLKEHKLI